MCVQVLRQNLEVESETEIPRIRMDDKMKHREKDEGIQTSRDLMLYIFKVCLYTKFHSQV